MTAECDTAEIRWLPGWSLRAALLLGCLGALALLAVPQVRWFALLSLLVVAVVSTTVPDSLAPALFLGGSAVLAMSADAPALRWQVLALIPVLHLVHVLAAYAALLPVRARLHPAALRTPARRFAAIELAVFAGAALLALVRAGQLSVPVQVLGLVALITGFAGCAMLLRHRD